MQTIDLLTREKDRAAFCNLAHSLSLDPSIAEKAQQALTPQIMYSGGGSASRSAP
jgi:hypothetical protein